MQIDFVVMIQTVVLGAVPFGCRFSGINSGVLFAYFKNSHVISR